MNRLNKYYLANGYYLPLIINILVSFSKLRYQITPLYRFTFTLNYYLFREFDGRLRPYQNTRKASPEF